MAELNHPEGGREADTNFDKLLGSLSDQKDANSQKLSRSTLEIVEDKLGYLDAETTPRDSDSEYSDTIFVNGEPVITTGRDVSRFVVDVRDDGDPSLTFRSIVLGTVFAGLGAALCQVLLCNPCTKRL